MNTTLSEWAEFALNHVTSVRSALISSLKSGNRLTLHVSRRKDTLWADLIAEKLLRKELRSVRVRAIVLSEEMGWKTFAAKELSRPTVRIVLDPFDGSSLFGRSIDTMWYTSIAVYDEDYHPLVGCVADIISGKCYLSDEKVAYTTQVDRDHKHPKLKRMIPSKTSKLRDAYVACYMMKPKYLNSSNRKFGSVLQGCGFIYPNGGPSCVAKVASGELDAYLVTGERVEELFSAFPIAIASGALVTDLKGNALQFGPTIRARLHGLVCSNRTIQSLILRKLRAQ